jgi:hypothetical protein
MSEVELHLRGLKPEAQMRVLKFLGLKSPEDGNLDVFPIATISKSDDALPEARKPPSGLKNSEEPAFER